MKNIIITGGAGFIGSHVVRLFVNKYPEYHIINLDKLTYAGNLANLKDIEDKPNYTFVKGDICDFDLMLKLMQDYKVDGIIHLAAESHVDRSIKDPFTFAQTNVMGTLSLLQAAKIYWESLPEGYEGKRFYHISTDEVYGALQMTHPEGIPAPFTTKASSGKNHEAYGEEFFVETTKYNPHSPYSASKASSDHFVRAFHDTYGMPTIVTNCSNNYGPYQFPEKLIPLFINNIRHRKPLPVYGKGENVRDWLYVVDHARRAQTAAHRLPHRHRQGRRHRASGRDRSRKAGGHQPGRHRADGQPDAVARRRLAGRRLPRARHLAKRHQRRGEGCIQEYGQTQPPRPCGYARRRRQGGCHTQTAGDKPRQGDDLSGKKHVGSGDACHAAGSNSRR